MVRRRCDVAAMLFLMFLMCTQLIQGTNTYDLKDGNHTVIICNSECVRNRRSTENSVSQQLRDLLQHYKQDDPVGLPGAPIPDPVDVPDLKKSFAVSTMTFKQIKVHGLSNFRFQHIRADLAKLEMAVGVKIQRLLINGQYTLGGWFSRSNGPFTVTLTGVLVEGVAALQVDRGGQLHAEDIHMDIRFQTIQLDFQNLGGMAYLFQGLMNSVGTFLFDGIKPFLLNEVNTRLLAVINENIVKVPQRFPNSIPPLDMAIATFRADIRKQGFDPYYVGETTKRLGGPEVRIKEFWVTGLSSFYRVGEVSLAVINNTANATLQVGTKRVEGSCHWEISLGWFSKAGSAKFWVDYLQARVSVLQPLNVEKKPRIDQLALKIGNIQTRVEGSGTLDYVAELVLNVLPNVLRYQLIMLIEEPLKQQVQEKLNTLDVEKMIMEQLDKLEQGGGEEKPAEGEDGNPEEEKEEPAPSLVETMPPELGSDVNDIDDDGLDDDY